MLCLECETSHTICTKWKFNGKELNGMDHRELVQEGRVHKLVIKQPTAFDSGLYECFVKDQSTASKVIVQGENKFIVIRIKLILFRDIFT